VRGCTVLTRRLAGPQRPELRIAIQSVFTGSRAASARAKPLARPSHTSNLCGVIGQIWPCWSLHTATLAPNCSAELEAGRLQHPGSVMSHVYVARVSSGGRHYGNPGLNSNYVVLARSARHAVRLIRQEVGPGCTVQLLPEYIIPRDTIERLALRDGRPKQIT
jgi:hypothetical protein